jgi:nucleoside phosphorylase
MKNFEAAKAHFLNFSQEKTGDYILDTREFKIWPRGGYPDFYNAAEVITVQHNLSSNFEEGFYDIDSLAPETVRRKWESFLSYLENGFSLCEKTIGILQGSGGNVDLPYPLLKITNNIQEVVDELRYILNISEENLSTDASVLPQVQNLPDKLSEIVAKFEHPIRKENPFGEDFYEIVIITAIQVEFHHVKNLLINPTVIHKKDDTKVSYCTGSFDNGVKSYRVMVACANQMGMTAAGIVTLNLVYKLKPKLVIMTGICAGVVGEVGDVLIPESLWDYGSGKRDLLTEKHNGNKRKKDKSNFKHYRSAASIKPSFVGRMYELQREQKYLDDIASSYQNPNWKSSPEHIYTHVGPFSSGAAVVANDDVLSEIKSQDGKLIGFDMEAYAIAYACQNCDIQPKPIPLIFKSISDKGDKRKNHKLKEEHQDFAAYTSANYMYKIIMEELDTFIDI